MVQKTVRREVGAGSVDAIDKTSEEGEIFYDVDATRDAKSWAFSVSSDGALDQALELAETPETVRTAIIKEVGGGKIDTIDKTSDGDEIFYDVDYTKGGLTRSFSVSPDGALCELIDQDEPAGHASQGSLAQRLLFGAMILLLGAGGAAWWVRKRSHA